jgi:prenyl protein peptidase
VLACAISFLIVWWYCDTTLVETISLMGINTKISYKPIFSVVLLFIGSIKTEYEQGGLFGVETAYWITIRNYVAAPIVEEWVFRSCTIALMKKTFTTSSIVFLSPISFGVAHLHHGYQRYKELGADRNALQRAILMSLFQFAYTTLFGFYAAFALLESGIMTSILIHMFCNYMGFPDFSQNLNWHIIGILLFLTMNVWS